MRPAIVAALLCATVILAMCVYLLVDPTCPFAPLSFELRSAPCAPTQLDRVRLWLAEHKPIIVSAEKAFKVDRRAIAGVIAEEALQNVHTSMFGIVRSIGPGKVHYRATYTKEGEPISKEIEDAHYLPQRSLQQRKAILATTPGAVRYIAAILDALAVQARTSGGYRTRCNPSELGYMYNQMDLPAAQRYFLHHAYPKPFPQDFMGRWISRHEQYLTRAVGKPNIPECGKE